MKIFLILMLLSNKILGQCLSYDVSLAPAPLFCKGVTDSVQVIVSGGTAPYTYSWFVASSLSSSYQSADSSRFFSLTIPGNTIVSVLVTDSNNCSDSAGFIVFTDSITITALLNGSAGNKEVCLGGSINLNSNVQHSTGGNVFLWSGPGSYSDNSQDPASFSATAGSAGAYIVTVTDDNGCTATDQVSVTNVNPLPSVAATVNDTLVCDGGPLNLNSTPAGGTPPYSSFSWTGPSFSDTIQNPAPFSAVQGSSGTYTVTVTDSEGCTGSGTVDVQVNNAVTVNAMANTSPSTVTICEGNAIDLNSNASGGTGNFSSYSWTGPVSYSNSQQNPPSFVSVAASSGTYTVTVTDDEGCTASDGITVNVNNGATVNAGMAQQACSGDTIFLTGTIGGNATSATWSSSGNGLFGDSALVNTYYIHDPAHFNGGSDTLTLTTDNPPGPCPAVSAASIVTIVKNPVVPGLTGMTAQDFVLCNGSKNVCLVASGDPGSHFQWSSDNLQTIIYYANSDSSVINIDFPDTSASYQNIFTITAVDTASGCTTDTTCIFTIDGTRDAPDTVPVAFKLLGNTLIALDNTVDFYQWGYDDLQLLPHKLTGEVYQVYHALDSFDILKKYYWVITGIDSCTTKSYYNNPYKKSGPVSPGPDNSGEPVLAVLPNPNNGSFTVDVSGSIYGEISLRLIDSYGRLSYSQSIYKTDDHQRFEFGLSGLAPGVYLIELRGLKDERLVSKLFIR